MMRLCVSPVPTSWSVARRGTSVLVWRSCSASNWAIRLSSTLSISARSQFESKPPCWYACSQRRRTLLSNRCGAGRISCGRSRAWYSWVDLLGVFFSAAARADPQELLEVIGHVAIAFALVQEGEIGPDQRGPAAQQEGDLPDLELLGGELGAAR